MESRAIALAIAAIRDPRPVKTTTFPMASHQIAIAKASFCACLLRPDPTSVPREEISTFHSLLDRALSHCSPANLQTCKLWLLRYVAFSSNRVGGWAKYLVVLAGSFEPSQESARPRPSAKRRQLHILYLLNDLLHHSKYHLDSTATFSTTSGSLQPYLVDLLGHAAAYDRQKHPRHHRRLDDLLDIWSEHGYFSSDFIDKLREVVKNAAILGTAPPSSTDAEVGQADAAKKLPGKEVPFIMPPSHGDPSTPYYDLPAANLVPHIIPNSTIPLRPDTIKPLQFLRGPADASLVHALKDFLKDVDRIYGADDLIKGDGHTDIDELGQTINRDEITGDILDGETYYGWSRAFCQQMRKRKPYDSRGRSRSGSRTRDGPRRRYSDSSMSQDSRRSESRPPSRDQSRRHGARPHYDASSRSRSRSPRRSRTHESSYSPRESSPPRFPPTHHQPPPPNVSYPPHQPYPYGAPYGQPPMQSNPGFPPPPPPNYHGACPPYPPSQMPGMPFPPPGPEMSHSAFPPYQASSMSMGAGQHMPPGQFYFPPPYSGGQHGGWGGPPPGGSSQR
ncbi:hypothetical protein NUU61_002008 [Penicillium alfredii]|uniref:CID domain-containing protein n=1 Tax=Penicillium alfredii TaxID=1506179 RepID=A0A9W9FQN8_9EURO|nr:uncharacterized protein NUU61_002008 [Penicillium alfredii]KAJ5104661.1 hypothetical protein NUU61_002008 [Penicillium alfredii]